MVGTNDSARGLAKICEILGITKDEFIRLFPCRNGGSVDHSQIVGKFAELENNSNLDIADIEDISIEGDYDGITLIKHNREYNYVINRSKLLSPKVWFKTSNSFRNGNCSVSPSGDHSNKDWNILTTDGTMLLDSDVYDIRFSENNKYAKILVKRDESRNYYNIVNLNTGALFLKSPVISVSLANRYGSGIPVIKEPNGKWEIVNIHGKTIATTGSDNIGYCGINFVTIRDEIHNTYKMISKKNGRVLWTMPHGWRANGYVSACDVLVTTDTNSKYHFINSEGKDIVPNGVDGSNSPSSEYDLCDNIAVRNNGKWSIINVKTGENLIEDLNVREMGVYFGNLYTIYTNGKFSIYKNKELIKDDAKIVNYCKNTNIVICYNTNPNVSANERFFIINYETGEQTSKAYRQIKCNYNYNGNYFAYANVNDKYIVIGLNGIEVSETIMSDVEPIYLGYNQFLIRVRDGHSIKYNILKENGKLMFKYGFDSYKGVPVYSKLGIFKIVAGRNLYYINAYGDVSRSIEQLVESKFLDDEKPLLIEHKHIPEISNFFKNAAYLLD